jgi:hypothetical protein
MPGLINSWKDGDEENWGTVENMDGRFYGAFIAPAAIRAAFEACCPLIALNACHTKSRYRMILFTASTVDGNNKILPLA